MTNEKFARKITSKQEVKNTMELCHPNFIWYFLTKGDVKIISLNCIYQQSTKNNCARNALFSSLNLQMANI